MAICPCQGGKLGIFLPSGGHDGRSDVRRGRCLHRPGGTEFQIVRRAAGPHAATMMRWLSGGGLRAARPTRKIGDYGEDGQGRPLLRRVGAGAWGITDRRTSDVGHRLAMTGLQELRWAAGHMGPALQKIFVGQGQRALPEGCGAGPEWVVPTRRRGYGSPHQ